jgi:type VII secretion-associated serine protease mycosin
VAWRVTRGAGVTVAVIDSGSSPEHPALVGKVRSGRDFVVEAGRRLPDGIGGLRPGQCDEFGHGTVIAGIIAGRETSSGGYRFAGIAPEATILPVRVLLDDTVLFDATLSGRIASAIRWAVDEGDADVLNLSLTTVPTSALRNAIRHAVDSGVVVVAAAGNAGESGGIQVAYPAAYDGVIGVAGVDPDDHRVPSSSVGEHVDVAGPGKDIFGPAPRGDGYVYVEAGTSFATAYVSGVAALVRAHEPGLTPAQVLERITRTADHRPGGWNPEVGHGVVNPARAVGALTGLAGGAAPPTSGRLEIPEAQQPVRDGVGAVAPWLAVGAALAALAVLLAVPLARRGRDRSWRPGRS